MTIAADITVSDEEIAAICKRYHIRELSLFGSAARGEMTPDSDVDLLVDFEPEARIGLLELSAMTREFSHLIGRRADVAIKRALKPRVRPAVLSDARVLYAA
jgi:predicted nucleotidyltransferase